MKKILVILSLLLVCLRLSAQENVSPQAILEASDRAYIPEIVKFDLRIESFRKWKRIQWFSLECFEKGVGKYLAVFNNPAIMKGQSQLRIGDIIFNYVRKIDRIRQVSARINFYNSVLSQEDIMSTMLSNFYTPESIKLITDETGRDIYSMTLLAKSRKVAYAKIIALIDVKTFLPIRREYFTYSGQKVKEMIIDKIQKKNGKMNLVKFRVVDSLRNDYYSMVTLDNFETNITMPDSWFTQQYMRIVAR